MFDFLNGKPVVLNTSFPFVLIGPNPDDPYHPDIPLVKSEHGSTELLGYVRSRELGNDISRRKDVEVIRAKGLVPYRRVDSDDKLGNQQEAPFVFVWRGLTSSYGRDEVRSAFEKTLPDIIHTIYTDGDVSDATIEWAVSQLISVADTQMVSPNSIRGILHPSRRDALLGWYLLVVVILTILFLTAYSFWQSRPY
jgi:hypothetical protein